MTHLCCHDYGVLTSDPIWHIRWFLWLLGRYFAMQTVLVCNLVNIYAPCDALYDKQQSDNHQHKIMSTSTRHLYGISTDRHQNILPERNTISFYCSLHIGTQDSWIYRLRFRWIQYAQCVNKKHTKWLANTHKGAGVNRNWLTAFNVLILNIRIDFLMYFYDRSLWLGMIKYSDNQNNLGAWKVFGSY